MKKEFVGWISREVDTQDILQWTQQVDQYLDLGTLYGIYKSKKGWTKGNKNDLPKRVMVTIEDI